MLGIMTAFMLTGLFLAMVRTTSLAEFLLPMKITPLEGLTTSSIAVPDLFYLIITEVGMYFDNTN